MEFMRFAIRDHCPFSLQGGPKTNALGDQRILVFAVFGTLCREDKSL